MGEGGQASTLGLSSEPAWGPGGESPHSPGGLRTAMVMSFQLKGRGCGKHGLGRYYGGRGLRRAPLKDDRRSHPETGSRGAYLPGKW